MSADKVECAQGKTRAPATAPTVVADNLEDKLVRVVTLKLEAANE